MLIETYVNNMIEKLTSWQRDLVLKSFARSQREGLVACSEVGMENKNASKRFARASRLTQTRPRWVLCALQILLASHGKRVPQYALLKIIVFQAQEISTK